MNTIKDIGIIKEGKENFSDNLPVFEVPDKVYGILEVGELDVIKGGELEFEMEENDLPELNSRESDNSLDLEEILENQEKLKLDEILKLIEEFLIILNYNEKFENKKSLKKRMKLIYSNKNNFSKEFEKYEKLLKRDKLLEKQEELIISEIGLLLIKIGFLYKFQKHREIEIYFIEVKNYLKEINLPKIFFQYIFNFGKLLGIDKNINTNEYEEVGIKIEVKKALESMKEQFLEKIDKILEKLGFYDLEDLYNFEELKKIIIFDGLNLEDFQQKITKYEETIRTNDMLIEFLGPKKLKIGMDLLRLIPLFYEKQFKEILQKLTKNILEYISTQEKMLKDLKGDYFIGHLDFTVKQDIEQKEIGEDIINLINELINQIFLLTKVNICNNE